MTRPLILLALCLCVLGGCGRKGKSSDAAMPQPTAEQAAQIESEYLLPTNDTTTAAAPPTDANPSPAQPAPKPQAPARPIQERINGAVHAQLTVQLRMFVEKNGRMPTSFSEFANSTMDSVPLAPPGMKFVIDQTDRTVKAVKK